MVNVFDTAKAQMLIDSNKKAVSLGALYHNYFH